MQKLTQQEANTLIRKAWQDVEKYSLGSYRFGHYLWDNIPARLREQALSEDEYFFNGFLYEPNSDIATAKFMTYFVEEN